MSLNILVTGGAGYIGGHVVKQLLELTDHNVFVLDSLHHEDNQNINFLLTIRSFEFYKVDLLNYESLTELSSLKDIDIIMHFAAFSIVEESINNPLKYYNNNVTSTINILKLAELFNIEKIIFSSSASVYGEVKNGTKEVVTESYPTNPINPYGVSKFICEQIILDSFKEKNYVIFRYFNVAGADMNFTNLQLSPRIGQLPNNAKSLIKLTAECALGQRNYLEVFGSDFNTNDGTALRDYIHVEDLADAHIKAISYVQRNSNIFNVGYGLGFSVLDVINTMRKVSDNNFNVIFSPRRIGEPEAVVADNKKVINKLQWKPKFDNLEVICRSAYLWELKNGI